MKIIEKILAQNRFIHTCQQPHELQSEHAKEFARKCNWIVKWFKSILLNDKILIADTMLLFPIQVRLFFSCLL